MPHVFASLPQVFTALSQGFADLSQVFADVSQVFAGLPQVFAGLPQVFEGLPGVFELLLFASAVLVVRGLGGGRDLPLGRQAGLGGGVGPTAGQGYGQDLVFDHAWRHVVPEVSQGAPVGRG